VTERRGRRRKKRLDDLKEKRGYWKLKEEAIDHTTWRIRFGRGYGLVVRQTAAWMSCCILRASYETLYVARLGIINVTVGAT
jgi:hypothetical protein